MTERKHRISLRGGDGPHTDAARQRDPLRGRHRRVTPVCAQTHLARTLICLNETGWNGVSAGAAWQAGLGFSLSWACDERKIRPATAARIHRLRLGSRALCSVVLEFRRTGFHLSDGGEKQSALYRTRRDDSSQGGRVLLTQVRIVSERPRSHKLTDSAESAGLPWT